ncbi:MAG: DNA translocase FtsK, partial [Rubricoccaceae bacterium]|nr:DNA translocase FtsK [Rubricoccaceae bacterium]
QPVEEDSDTLVDDLVRAHQGDGASSQGPTFSIHKPVEEEQADLDKERPRQPDAHSFSYQFPSIELLEDPEKHHKLDVDEIEENKQILLDKLDTYNIEIEEIDAIVGPTVTRYELTPAPGVKISRITALEDDLAMALAAPGIRIIAPIPGKSSIGVEIANRSRELVRLRSMLSTAKFLDASSQEGGSMELPVAIGKTIEGEVFLMDLAKMPHLLVAGATGSGKSVGINTLITGLLYACHPADLKFVMVDPKKIELSIFSGLLDHFIAMPEDADDPITTDFALAAGVLKCCEREMELRYDLLSEAGVRGITEYNERVASGALDNLEGDHRHLPYIVLVIDELADLMMTSGKEVEAPIARLAQMARSVGIHLVIATQRPSVDVITGLIKANFPSRIAYQVASRIDSRTILDVGGAQHLIGNGDLLYMNGSRVTRLQGPFISLEEVEAIVHFIQAQKGAGPYLLPPVEDELPSASGSIRSDSERDELFVEAARVIVRSQQGSVSLLQRKLSVGYTRAARIVDQLEDAGIVGPFEGSKARDVLVADEIQLDALLSESNS